MSKITKSAKEKTAIKKETENLKLAETEINYMGGQSYSVNPLLKLKMITASSIFGEAQYYRGSNMVKNKLWKGLHDLLLFSENDNKTTVEIMEQTIDAALDYDFIATVNWAIVLRETYFMRLNPQIIMVRAAIHPKRKIISEKLRYYSNDMEDSNWFRSANLKIMKRADEPAVQMAYYIHLNNGSVSKCPNVLKRSWKDKLESLNNYQVNKYKNAEIGMINVARVCHASKGHIPELMQTGTVIAEDSSKTWETLRSAGMPWTEILHTINLPHMARLRNIANVFTEIDNTSIAKEYMDTLKNGVLAGKQFPFRYWSAYKNIQVRKGLHNLSVLLDGLENCIDIAIDNMPKLNGKTMCLSDNSGSAWGAITSEYGSVTVAEIDNLSSVITAINSEEGYVGKFGDKLKTFAITKRNGVLTQVEKITKKRYSDVGGNTEGGIWEFFKNAIDKKEWWDNIFIYSDQQAGHGGLYGTAEHINEYKKLGYNLDGYINVFKLIEDYRRHVNSKVNVFCIQTAGYKNVLVPEYAYRTNILYGWTGKELLFADTMNKLWNEYDALQIEKQKN